MNIKNTFNKMILGTSLITATACQKTPIQKLPQSFKSPLIERIDSFAKSSLNKADTANLNLFAIDTIKISNKDFDKPEELLKKLVKRGGKLIPKVKIGTEIENKTFVFNNKIQIIPTVVDKKAPQYLKDSTKAVMQNEVYTDNKNFYIPVKYYSKLNPDLPKGTKLNNKIKEYRR